jgi:hypothetical protein
MTYIRQQAQEHLKTHIEQRMPEEYHKVEVSITQVLKKAWKIVDKTADERIRLQALALIRDCNNTKMDMMTNGVVVSDAVKYVNGKAEKLDRQVKAEKDSAFDYESESEEVTQTEQIENVLTLEQTEEDKTTNDVF